MVSSAPLFYDNVRFFIDLAVLIVSLVVQATALVHCVTQRGDGFQAIGTLPKGAWLAILGICFALTFFGISRPTGIFGLIGLAAALIYLLDVRTGLRDLSDGKGFW
jgi:choline-glycine betaine transporter